jgi:hypothetical protein
MLERGGVRQKFLRLLWDRVQVHCVLCPRVSSAMDSVLKKLKKSNFYTHHQKSVILDVGSTVTGGGDGPVTHLLPANVSCPRHCAPRSADTFSVPKVLCMYRSEFLPGPDTPTHVLVECKVSGCICVSFVRSVCWCARVSA